MLHDCKKSWYLLTLHDFDIKVNRDLKICLEVRTSCFLPHFTKKIFFFLSKLDFFEWNLCKVGQKQKILTQTEFQEAYILCVACSRILFFKSIWKILTYNVDTKKQTAKLPLQGKHFVPEFSHDGILHNFLKLLFFAEIFERKFLNFIKRKNAREMILLLFFVFIFGSTLSLFVSGHRYHSNCTCCLNK